jgi:hypothetical protein
MRRDKKLTGDASRHSDVRFFGKAAVWVRNECFPKRGTLIDDDGDNVGSLVSSVRTGIGDTGKSARVAMREGVNASCKRAPVV